MPGSRPVLNREVLVCGIKLAKMLGCTIADETWFSRKTYFYPDMSKSVQITQYDHPIGVGGVVYLNGKPIRITRIHLEEDPGKTKRTGDMHALVDYNRSGIPLAEIVTEPDLSTPAEARAKVEAISKKYGLAVDLDAKVEDISVGMQQRVEILKMLYRDNEILIFDEPTAVLTPQEIAELMQIMKNLTKEGKSILFISHKLNEIMEVSDRVSVLRKGKYIGTVNTAETDKQSLSNMMVGRPVQLEVQKTPAKPKEPVLHVEHLCVASHLHKKDAVHDVSFDVHAGEILCIAGIDGNGQTELIYGLTGLDKPTSGKIELCGKDITHASIHKRLENLSHIPEDRHKHGLVLDFTLEQNMVLQRYRDKQFQNHSFIRDDEVRKYAEGLIERFDVRSGQGPITVARSMSGGNQQKAIIARELDREKPLVIAVQPTRGLDVGAIEFIHSQLVAQRDAGKAVLLVSLELDEVMSLSDRILVMYEGEIVGELDPKQTTVAELGLYMAGAKRDTEGGESK